MAEPIISTPDHSDQVLVEQQLYYDERGAHDEDRFFRRGRFDRGPQLNREWFSEVFEVVQMLTEFAPRGEVLELAVGTGVWTRHLAASAERCAVLDSSQESLEMVKTRLAYLNPRMEYIQADIFRWTTRKRYDVIFFGFWLTHVPPYLFEAFWNLLRGILKPKGRVFFVDSFDSNLTLVRYGNVDPVTQVQTRELRPGRPLRVYKVFYKPAELQKRLSELGWSATVKTTSKYFLYGSAAPIDSAALP